MLTAKLVFVDLFLLRFIFHDQSHHEQPWWQYDVYHSGKRYEILLGAEGDQERIWTVD